MARITKPLTNTEVKQAKSKEKEFNLVDGNGLALRIKPNGSKLWVFNYFRPYTRKRTSLSFGSYPTISLAEARTKRYEAQALLAKEIDPKEYRDDNRRLNDIAHNNTLEHIASQWLEIKKSKVSLNHAADIWRSLSNAVLETAFLFVYHIFFVHLAHTGSNEVRNAYNRADYIERRKRIMNWWSEHIENAAIGNMRLSGKKGIKLASA